MDRYTVISADCHAGADLLDYRPFLESKYHDAFDEWAATFVSPYGDLVQPDADRNWDSTRRMRELEADGVVGEIVYPNTIPPFYDSLVGKLIVHGKTRPECLMRLKRALDEFVVDGIETTLPLFRALVREKDIIDGNYHIHWLEQFLAQGHVDR